MYWGREEDIEWIYDLACDLWLPTCDLPFLWKLKDEIEEAVNEILAMDKYHKLQQVFAERPNPKCSRFSYAMAFKENKIISNILIKIKDETSADPICLLFDGLILEAKTSDLKEKIAEVIETIENELGLKLSLNILWWKKKKSEPEKHLHVLWNFMIFSSWNLKKYIYKWKIVSFEHLATYTILRVYWLHFMIK